jgi:uracil-DNA glycosylase
VHGVCGNEPSERPQTSQFRRAERPGWYSTPMQPRPAVSPAGFDRLMAEIRGCNRCAGLPLGPKPVVRGRPTARLLIVSQAPGTRAHQTGLSFNDNSGDRLRLWLGLEREAFYDEARVALMPIGFCYPGRYPRGGDLPPRPECAPFWHPRLRPHFAGVGLTLLVGSYAIRHYLPERRQPLAEIIAGWRDLLPGEERAAIGAGEIAAQIEHSDAGQRPGRGLAHRRRSRSRIPATVRNTRFAR